MLGDRIFYPLAGLIIVGMVIFALAFGGGPSITNQDIIDNGISLSGEDLLTLTISPGSTSTFVDEEGGYMRLSQFTPRGEGPSSIGVFLTLSADYERAFSGRTLRITYRARAARIDPLQTFELAYYPYETPSSGWKPFDLTPDWQDYSYDFSPPITNQSPNVDFVALFPGTTGEQKKIDLAAIRITVIDPVTDH